MKKDYYERNFGTNRVFVSLDGGISIKGNYNSNFGVVYDNPKPNALGQVQTFGMDWDYGLTPRIIDYINSSIYKLKFVHTLVEQFEDMIQRGIIPLFEIKLPDDEWLIINISLNYTDKLERFNGIRFSFDKDGKPCHFDGSIRKLGDGVYLVPVDDCLEDLDDYLEIIYDNITEGYLIPNGLFV